MLLEISQLNKERLSLSSREAVRSWFLIGVARFLICNKTKQLMAYAFIRSKNKNKIILKKSYSVYRACARSGHMDLNTINTVTTLTELSFSCVGQMKESEFAPQNKPHWHKDDFRLIIF